MTQQVVARGRGCFTELAHVCGCDRYELLGAGGATRSGEHKWLFCSENVLLDGDYPVDIRPKPIVLANRDRLPKVLIRMRSGQTMISAESCGSRAAQNVLQALELSLPRIVGGLLKMCD